MEIWQPAPLHGQSRTWKTQNLFKAMDKDLKADFPSPLPTKEKQNLPEFSSGNCCLLMI